MKRMNRISMLCLVDDDEIFRFLANEVIRGLELVDEIKQFANGKEALEYISSAIAGSNALPDVILLDLNMPVMDGWEFLENYVALKPRSEKKICIYIVSSSISPDDLHRARAISAVSDYFIKPVTEEQVSKIVMNC